MARRRYRSKSRGTGAQINLVFFLIVLAIIYQIILLIKKAVITVGEVISQLDIFEWTIILTSLSFIYYAIIVVKRKRIATKREREQEEKRIRILREGESEKLKVMNPHDFEWYIADLFKLKGFDTEVTKRSGDGGKDIILRRGDEIRIVECKRYNSPKVTRPDVQKFHSALIDMNAKEGYYVTTGRFTKPAEEYVLDKPIHLIDESKLLDLIEELREI